MLWEHRPSQLRRAGRLDVIDAGRSVKVDEPDHHSAVTTDHGADRPRRTRRIRGELHATDLEHLRGRGVWEIRGYHVIDELACSGRVAIDERIEDQERHDDEVEPLAADDVRRRQERLDTARS